MSDALIATVAKIERRLDDLVFPELTLTPAPLFSAYASAVIDNVTGDATSYTIIFNTEINDIWGNYNNATGIFTAPVTSKGYLLSANVLVLGIGAAHIIFSVALITSNRTYYGDTNMNPYAGGVGGWYTGQVTVIADMDAADTAHIAVTVSGGAKTVDVYGAAAPYTYFQGFMLT